MSLVCIQALQVAQDQQGHQAKQAQQEPQALEPELLQPLRRHRPPPLLLPVLQLVLLRALKLLRVAVLLLVRARAPLLQVPVWVLVVPLLEQALVEQASTV